MCFWLVCFLRVESRRVVLVRCLYCSKLFLACDDVSPCGVCGYWDVVLVERLDV